MFISNNCFYWKNRKKEYFSHNLASEKTKCLDQQSYISAAFGRFDQKFVKLLDYSNCQAAKGFYSAFYQSSELFLYDIQGNLIEKKTNFFNTFTPYDIQLSKDEKSLWLATGSEQVVVCKEIGSGKINYQLGQAYEEDSLLSYPEALYRFEDWLYISEMGNNRISRLHLESFEFQIYRQFQESVWEFAKLGDQDFLRLDSGVYKLCLDKLVKLGS